MKPITGTMIYYYCVCKRKLWYFCHQLDMENTSELVGIGKLVDEESYSREKKHILIDEAVNIDFLQSWKIVHEVKKSRSIELASVWQLKYYMMILEGKGLEIEKGILDFPNIRKRKVIYLSDDDRLQLGKITEEIKSIISAEFPPELIKRGICKKCAYYEFCFI
ncbi:MAG: CRISPR-associated protein Cas4 [Eubacterium sp.]|nr:CRISPR-associated protein Cas4 [Gallibacter sp.]MDY6038199.1 CRISPR-associated protein Cas4 [Eubacterium sp.]